MESSAYRSTTTLTGDEKAMKRIVYRILQVLPDVPEGFAKDTSHSSDLSLKKNGILQLLQHQTVRGTESLNE